MHLQQLRRFDAWLYRMRNLSTGLAFAWFSWYHNRVIIMFINLGTNEIFQRTRVMHTDIHDISLSELVEQVKAGHEIVLKENGTVFAKIIPATASSNQFRRFGAMRGEIELEDDFDGPLPDDIAKAFGVLDES